MSYRSDLDAAYARIAQLERRIRELEKSKLLGLCRECDEKLDKVPYMEGTINQDNYRAHGAVEVPKSTYWIGEDPDRKYLNYMPENAMIMKQPGLVIETRGNKQRYSYDLSYFGQHARGILHDDGTIEVVVPQKIR